MPDSSAHSSHTAYSQMAHSHPQAVHAVQPADSGAVAGVSDSLAALYPMPDTARLEVWKAVRDAATAKARADSLAWVEAQPEPWESGLSPQHKPVSAASDSGLLAMLVTTLLVVILCMRHAGRLFAMLRHDVFDMRDRTRDFDEHTSGESRLMVLFGVQLTVYLGFLLLSLAEVNSAAPFSEWRLNNVAWTLTGVAGLYYLLQLVAYRAVGYAFTDGERCRQWLRGFNASQALLGFGLAVPAIVTVFYPVAAPQALLVAAVLYVAARLAFIYKGFRIFYTNPGSLFYFILYLCSLEIIPPLAVLLFAVTCV